MENKTDNDMPLPAHEPGQVIGPSQSASPVSPTSPSPPELLAQTPANRPAAVTVPAPQSGVMVNGQPVSHNEQQMASPKKHFRLSKKLLVPVVVVLALLGSGAAAYFGYYVPNKPENILAKSVQNTLLTPSFTTKGTITATSSGVSGKIDYTAKVDNTSHAVDLNLDTTISGVEIPLEILSAKGNLYFKVGDLTTVEGLISQFGAAFGADTQQFEAKLNKSVSNQWIVIDSTLVKEAKLSCLANYPAQLSQPDVQALTDAYKNDKFITIHSHSSDTVDGKAATKYQLTIDDNKLSSFDVSGAGYFKQLNSCLKSISSTGKFDLSSLKDNQTTPLSVWVDKGEKRIVKYESDNFVQDKNSKDSGSLSGTVSYGAVNIQAPSNAKPVLNLINDLGLGSIVSDTIGTYTGTQSAAKDTKRQTDINAITTILEGAYTDNGYYPTLAQLNSTQWVLANVQGLDGFSSATYKDPDGTTAQLSATPAANVYAYQPIPAGCNNTSVKCQHYTLTATLSTGKTYVKQSLN